MIHTLNIGSTLGRYQITELIQEGGQARVLRGRHTNTGDDVAIRQLTASPNDLGYRQELARFWRTTRIMTGHPNIVDPIDSGTEGGIPYMVMRYLSGFSLEVVCHRSGGRLPSEEALLILRQLAAAIQMCHDKGIVHRDIKPDNIIIDASGIAVLLDFGIASVESEKTISDGKGFLGTPPFAAPEQFLEKGCRQRSIDIYAMGAVLYRMVTGGPPATGGSLQAYERAVLHYTPRPPALLNADVPVPLSTLCMRLLAKDPGDRFSTAGEVLQALDDVLRSSNLTCAACGRPLSVHARFCSSCGARADMGAQPLRCIACGSVLGSLNRCVGCQRPFSSAGHRLTFTSGSLTGSTFLLPEGVYEVGRDVLAARDSHISRRHLRLRCANGAVYVEDLGSANKTYVNGQLADRPMSLTSSSEVAIAGCRGVYTCLNGKVLS